ncbi:MAG: hypothetical protein U0529_10775 [Thermoanaerobaculia bacterium]
MSDDHEGGRETAPTEAAGDDRARTEVQLTKACLLEASRRYRQGVDRPPLGEAGGGGWKPGDRRVGSEGFDVEPGDVWIFEHSSAFEQAVEVFGKDYGEV